MPEAHADTVFVVVVFVVVTLAAMSPMVRLSFVVRRLDQPMV
ncbi:MAG: hypothetical protein AAGG08_13130 [Actinomycetota bacterium]